MQEKNEIRTKVVRGRKKSVKTLTIQENRALDSEKGDEVTDIKSEKVMKKQVFRICTCFFRRIHCLFAY